MGGDGCEADADDGDDGQTVSTGRAVDDRGWGLGPDIFSQASFEGSLLLRVCIPDVPELLTGLQGRECPSRCLELSELSVS